MDAGLEINAEKKKYMIMSRHPNSGQNQNIRTANESFKNVAKFKYLGTTLTDQNCYHSVQNIVFSSHIKKIKD
jgi:hypothetical protein